jgi:hypothetical protein
MRSTDDVIKAVLQEAPGVVQALSDAHGAAWVGTDRVTLELCRVRIAQLLCNVDEYASELDPALVGAISAWPRSEVLTAGQHACLAFAEEFVIDVASLADAAAAAVVAELGEQGFADFVNALLVIEQRQRMRLAWARLFPDVAA